MKKPHPKPLNENIVHKNRLPWKKNINLQTQSIPLYLTGGLFCRTCIEPCGPNEQHTRTQLQHCHSLQDLC